jgi:hypothetical protein
VSVKIAFDGLMEHTVATIRRRKVKDCSLKWSTLSIFRFKYIIIGERVEAHPFRREFSLLTP